jgi:hypothetical protein
MKMKTAMVFAAVSVLVSGCAETKSAPEIQGVSAQDPLYMIYGWRYEQDGIGWFTDTESRLNIDPHYKSAAENFPVKLGFVFVNFHKPVGH